MIYSPGHLVTGIKQLRMGSIECTCFFYPIARVLSLPYKPVELILLPTWECHAFWEALEEKVNQEKVARKQLKEKLPKDPFERAKAEFGLFDPVASSDWESYNKERTAAEEIMGALESGCDSEPFIDAVKNIVRSALGSNRIGDEDRDRIVNAISLTSCDVCWDDTDKVSDSFYLCLTLQCHYIDSER